MAGMVLRTVRRGQAAKDATISILTVSCHCEKNSTSHPVLKGGVASVFPIRYLNSMTSESEWVRENLIEDGNLVMTQLGNRQLFGHCYLHHSLFGSLLSGYSVMPRWSRGDISAIDTYLNAIREIFSGSSSTWFFLTNQTENDLIIREEHPADDINVSGQERFRDFERIVPEWGDRQYLLLLPESHHAAIVFSRTSREGFASFFGPELLFKAIHDALGNMTTKSDWVYENLTVDRHHWNLSPLGEKHSILKVPVGTLMGTIITGGIPHPPWHKPGADPLKALFSALKSAFEEQPATWFFVIDVDQALLWLRQEAPAGDITVTAHHQLVNFEWIPAEESADQYLLLLLDSHEAGVIFSREKDELEIACYGPDEYWNKISTALYGTSPPSEEG